jgi:heptosyltransferase III
LSFPLSLHHVRILVSRTDRIGDMVLTLPLCALLKTRLGAEVIVLGRGYTRPVLDASPYVDVALEWDELEQATPAARREFLADVQADVILHVFPEPAIARAARAARIPLRIGTSHRWYHWLTCNALEHFSRKRSPLHEAQLNVRLARRLLGSAVPTLQSLAPFTTLTPRATIPPPVAALLDDARTKIVLHPGSSGSAREWPLDHWKALVDSLDPARVQLFVSGSAAEGAALRDWIGALPAHIVDLTGRLSLSELIALLARVDGLAAASTGPLHLAAGVGVHALGLFPSTPPIHPGRWAPLGPRAEVLVAPSADLGDIAVDEVAARLRAWISDPHR